MEEGGEIETKSERIYTIYINVYTLSMLVCVCRKDTNESVGGHFAPWGSISTIFGSIVYMVGARRVYYYYIIMNASV